MLPTFTSVKYYTLPAKSETSSNIASAGGSSGLSRLYPFKKYLVSFPVFSPGLFHSAVMMKPSSTTTLKGGVRPRGAVDNYDRKCLVKYIIITISSQLTDVYNMTKPTAFPGSAHSPWTKRGSCFILHLYLIQDFCNIKKKHLKEPIHQL